MKKAYLKDIWRSVKRSKKRFFSIVLITVLGVTVLTGIYAACQDMYRSADLFYDTQNLFDIRILSTLGLTDEDVDALTGINGVETVTGAYSETVYTDVEGFIKEAELSVLNDSGLNQPHLLEGALPEKSGEIAVTPTYLEDTGKSIGDRVAIEEILEEIEDAEEAGSHASDTATGDTGIGIDLEADMELEEGEEPNFPVTEFTISGMVLDPMDISAKGLAFRASATVDYTFFILPADAVYDVYTAVYLTLTGLKELDCYSEEYEAAVQQAVNLIEDVIKSQREEARYEMVLAEALSKLADAETTMQESFAEADEKITDAWTEIADAKQELTDGEATLTQEEKDALRQLADARAELTSGLAELEAGEAELQASGALLSSGRVQLEAGKKSLEEQRKQALAQFEEAGKQFTAAQAELDAGQASLQSQLTSLQGALGVLWPQAQWDAYVNAVAAQAALGKGDMEIAAATAAEQAVLFSALTTAIDSMQSGLSQQILQLQLLLDAASQSVAETSEQLPAAKEAAVTAEAVLLEKQGTLSAAQARFDAENTKLQNMTEGTAEYAAQQQAVNNAQTALDTAKAEADLAQQGVNTAAAQLQELQTQLENQTVAATQYTAALAETNAQLAQLEAQPGLAAGLVEAGFGLGKIQGGQQLLNTQTAAFREQKQEALAQLDTAQATLAARETELLAGEQQLRAGRQLINDGKAELAAGRVTLEKEEAKALRELADAWRELADGKKELLDGEAELIESELDYAEKRTEAEEKLEEAYTKLEDIDMAQWYVQDRTALSSYSSLRSDMSSIEAVGNAFPVVFLIVAVLISLTTMTRMVEEERGLIGTYKALGYSDTDIYIKYLFYAFMACLIGGIVGDVFGFILLPMFLINILQVMYSMPYVLLGFDVLYGIGGILLFMVSIVLSTAIACRKELMQTPATLMRPKAPSAGSRIMLEYIPVVWNHLRFLNKVTARNLFRYKKRLFMTVLGIMGCTALVLAGFAIRDSVTDMMPKQYDRLYRYDLMVVTDAGDNDAFIADIENDANIAGFMNLQTDSFKVIGENGSSESVQLMVIPDGAPVERYLSIQDTDAQAVVLNGTGIMLTQNAAEMLNVRAGSVVTLQNLQLEKHEAVISEIVQNYLGNHVYITQGFYESLFGEYKPNAILAEFADSVEDQAVYAEGLLENEYVLSSVSTAALKADFSTNFTLINSVVYVLILLAAGLAFVVLFTLSNTNISERVRELATIKVLGFFDREVHAYVNKETLILTAIGVLLGLPAGRFVSGLLTSALQMPSLYFAVYIQPSSYVIAAVLSLCFALVVNILTNRSLDKIDMVEALKSVD